MASGVIDKLALAPPLPRRARAAPARRSHAARPKASGVVSADLTQHDLAEAFLAAKSRDGFSPVFAEGALYVPDASKLWVPMSPSELQVAVFRQHNGQRLCRKTVDARAIAAQVEAVADEPGFFSDAPRGVVSPAGFHQLGADGHVCTVPLEFRHRQTFALAEAPDDAQEAPLLDGLLRSAFEGDHAEEQIDLFWQAVGASLFGILPDYQVAILMLGRERSGKSVLQRVLEKVFPPHAVSAVSPASWGHEYHVAALAGKRLNVVGELPDDAPLPSSHFKNLLGQNLVAGRHPTHRPFSFRCQAAHWFAANVLPHTTDRSEAFYRRWRVLRFANTVPADRVDPQLFEKIVADEMPAIIAQAVAGAERVAVAGALRSTPPHEAVLERWRMASNPLMQFLTDSEWVEIDPTVRQHGTPEVYAAYRRWAAVTGFRHLFSRNVFTELLEINGAARGVALRRVGTRVVVEGIVLKQGLD